jgi:hypothetical protein
VVYLLLNNSLTVLINTLQAYLQKLYNEAMYQQLVQWNLAQAPHLYTKIQGLESGMSININQCHWWNIISFACAWKQNGHFHNFSATIVQYEQVPATQWQLCLGGP